jgi:hypothetical protein
MFAEGALHTESCDVRDSESLRTHRPGRPRAGRDRDLGVTGIKQSRPMWRGDRLRRAIQHLRGRRGTGAAASTTTRGSTAPAGLVRPEATRLGQHLRADPIYKYLHRSLSTAAPPAVALRYE